MQRRWYFVTMIAGFLLLVGVGIFMFASKSKYQAPGVSSEQESLLDGCAAIWRRIESTLPTGLMYQHPHSPELSLVDAPEGETDRLVRYLASIQPEIEELIAVSFRTCQPFPPSATDEERVRDVDVHMRHPKAWVLNFVRILSADASRSWDAGDKPGACVRMLAVQRYGTILLQQSDPATRVTGGGVIGIFLKKTNNMLSQGLLDGLTADTAAALRAIANSLDPVDPTGMKELAAEMAAEYAKDLATMKRMLNR